MGTIFAALHLRAESDLTVDGMSSTQMEERTHMQRELLQLRRELQISVSTVVRASQYPASAIQCF